MSKYRVFELAKEFNTDSKAILDILKRNKFKATNNFSGVGEEERTAIKNALSKGNKADKADKGAKAQKGKPQASSANVAEKKAAEKPADKTQTVKQNANNNNSGNNAHRHGAVHNNRDNRDNRNNGNNRAATSANRPAHNNNNNGNGGSNSRNNRNNGRNGGNNNRNDRRNGRSERNNSRSDRNNRFGGRNDRRGKGRNNKRGQQTPKVEIAHPKHIKLPETIAVKDLASKMSYTAAEVVKKLFMMGVMATINQEIDFDTAALVASEFGVTCEELPPEVDPTEIPEIEDDPKSLKLRPPVVTVMGHVDHGKTSLLDCIRNTHVQTHEAGGITQHIGAYQVNCKGKKIVFLDTPGHEAFTAMRARGAQITDIAVLVVAADDGVMPQTIEAIHHAKSAGVPIIVAINKIDKPGANPDHVKQELMEQGLVPEEYGGDTIMVPVSAKKQIGIDDLLEMILLVAEVKELKANPNRDARGVIVEAKLDKGRGPVATVLVQNGTLRIGDSVVCGTTYGKIRAMVNDRGENVKKAGPSVPVEILGLNDVPEAGDILAVLEEKQARSIAEARIERQRNNLIKSKKVSLDDLFHQIQEGDIKDLNIVIKADVQGSVEALSSSLLKLNKNDEVRVSIVHSGVGAVNAGFGVECPHYRIQCASGCQCPQACGHGKHRYPHVPRHLRCH